ITPIGFDAFDSERITKTEIAAHRRALEISRFLKKYMPGFEESYITATGVQTMPRHIRMIEAEYSLTSETLERTKEFVDSVHMADFGLPGPAFQVPYRIMVPKRIDNLLVAGKCVDGARLVRDIPVVMAMGQAAGTAAALSTRHDVSPRQLNVTALQRVLKEQQVILDISAAIERT
ncbi:MAG: FAD-dependent oxidoreductase, partial [Candidatus Bathyarchaeota archaeon]